MRFTHIIAATVALGLAMPAFAGEGFKRLTDGTELMATEIVSGLDRPSRITVDHEGALWIICSHDGRVLRRTVDGSTIVVGQIDVDSYNAETGQHGLLSGIAVRQSQIGFDVFVAITRAASTASIIKMTSDGRSLGAAQTIMSIPDVPYNRRLDIEPMSDGTLLVAIPAFDTPAPLSPATVT
ncbi:MAG: hypothetical protein MUC47_09105, partial [Candidatus Kapabacteria bacterium]|nr:hypothetical protein [Candidatus Kapabacteria bacterium]